MTTYCYPVHYDGAALPLYVCGIGVREVLSTISRNSGYPFYQIVLCLDGCGKMITPEKKIIIRKNNIVFVPKGLVHELVPTENTWQLVTLDLDGSGILPLLEALKFDKLRSDKLDKTDKLIEKLTEMMKTVRRKCSSCTYECSAMAYDLLMLLHNQLDMESENPDSLKRAQLAPVVYYIEENFRKEMTLDQLSAIIDISPQYLCRLFRDCYKMRPFEYLAKKRIQKAKMMLVEDGYTVNEVCQLVGYNDCSYFCSVFKKYENLSPAEFRALNCGVDQ